MEASMDAFALLADEHVLLRQLFEDFERPEPNDPRRPEDVVFETLNVLRVHARIEEELFYPAAAVALAEIPQAQAGYSHAAIAEAMERLSAIPPARPEVRLQFARLAEIACRHFAEEEQHLFPLLRRTGMDLTRLGERMAERRIELAVELGIASPGDTQAAEEAADEMHADRAAASRP
jgi:hemerythrin-like domain-containing protein